MRKAKRILGGLALLAAGVLYVWQSAVRAVPEVKRRKRAARSSAASPLPPSR